MSDTPHTVKPGETENNPWDTYDKPHTHWPCKTEHYGIYLKNHTPTNLVKQKMSHGIHLTKPICQPMYGRCRVLTLTLLLAPALHGKWRKNQLAKLKSTFLPDLVMNVQPVVEKSIFLQPIFIPQVMTSRMTYFIMWDSMETNFSHTYRKSGERTWKKVKFNEPDR